MISRDLDTLLTADKPTLFACHGYPWLIHRVTYRGTNHRNPHEHAFKEERTATTPFAMALMTDSGRLHVDPNVIGRVPAFASRAACAKQVIRDKLLEDLRHIGHHCEDPREIGDWNWSAPPRRAVDKQP